jgi:hypothetical protein
MSAENIARVVNRYPILYWASGSPLVTKPVLVDRGARGFQWVPPIPPDRDALLAGARAAGELDFWYAQNDRRLRIEFPYLLTTIRAARYFLRDVWRWQHLYESPHALAVLGAIVAEFVELGRQHGFTPVLLMIPFPQDLRSIERGGEPTYAGFLREAAAANPDLKVVDVAAGPGVVADRFYVGGPRRTGHASADGNAAIARSLAAAIESSRAVPAPGLP